LFAVVPLFPAVSTTLNKRISDPDNVTPSHVTAVCPVGTLLVISIKLLPLSIEPYNISPVAKAELKVAVIVWAAVSVIKSVFDEPLSVLISIEPIVIVGAVVSKT